MASLTWLSRTGSRPTSRSCSATAREDWGAPTNFPTGMTPFAVVTAGFAVATPTGFVDLAVPNYDSGTVSILRGDGAGAFTGPTNIPAGHVSRSAAVVGDFDGDGDVDLAVANNGSADVSILLNDSAAVFTAAPSVALPGAQPSGLAAADLNEDGHVDLIVADGTGRAWILLGHGTGGFTASPLTGLGGNPFGVAVSDFNGDDNVDVAISANTGSIVYVLLGTGLGGFGGPGTVLAGSAPRAPHALDFDGDGDTDLLVPVAASYSQSS